MNGFISRYIGFEGRISRKDWWIGVVVLAIAGIVLSVILGAIGLGMFPDMAALTAASSTGDGAAMSQAIAASTRRAAWVSVIMFVIFAYPGYALSMKRRHDKDNNGLDLQIYYGLTVLLMLAQALGIGYSSMEVANGISVPMPSPVLSVAGVLIGIFGIYLLVVLGFFKGTPGPNSYGPDPLTAA